MRPYSNKIYNEKMAYNITNLTAATNVYKLVEYANWASGNVMMTFLLFAVFFVILLRLINTGFERAILTASSISFLFGLLLSYVNLVNLRIPLAFLIVLAFTLFYTVVAQKQ